MSRKNEACHIGMSYVTSEWVMSRKNVLTWPQILRGTWPQILRGTWPQILRGISRGPTSHFSQILSHKKCVVSHSYMNESIPIPVKMSHVTCNYSYVTSNIPGHQHGVHEWCLKNLVTLTCLGTEGVIHMKDPPSKMRMGPQRAVAPPNLVVAPVKLCMVTCSPVSHKRRLSHSQCT